MGDLLADAAVREIKLEQEITTLRADLAAVKESHEHVNVRKILGDLAAARALLVRWRDERLSSVDDAELLNDTVSLMDKPERGEGE